MNVGAAFGLSALLATTGAACSSSSNEDKPSPLSSAFGYGPYGVGVRRLQARYQPLPDHERKLDAFVFYPAERSDDDSARAEFLTRTADRARWEVAPTSEASPKPVIVFSHGHQAFATIASGLAEHLASHGFVVVAPSHTGDTIGDGGTRTSDIYAFRPLDVSAVLTELLNLRPESWAGPLAPEAAVVGHSFGGYTAYVLGGARHDVAVLLARCRSAEPRSGFCDGLRPELEALYRTGFRDSRVQAVVALEPGDADLFGTTGASHLEVPALHVLAERSQTPDSDVYWPQIQGEDRYRLLLIDGDHNDLVESCRAGFDVRCSDLPKDAVLQELNARVQVFLEGHLRGPPSLAQHAAALLTGGLFAPKL